MEQNVHKVFVVVGQLYLRFLREKSFTGTITTPIVEEKIAEQDNNEKEMTSSERVSPKEVIAWLVTQPNTNGTLYLENVVKTYMSAIKNAPSKLALSKSVSRDAFGCIKLFEFDALCAVYKSAQNYADVNKAWRGQFSAGLAVYRRYLDYLENGKISHTTAFEQKHTELKPFARKGELQNSAAPQQVDFGRPKLCVQTRPLTCTIYGRAIVPSKQNWSQLLVAIVERLIADGNPNIESLISTPLYGSKAFFMPHKANYVTCKQLSNGKWICTNYNPQAIVTIIKNLCRHCEIDLSDVVITYESRGGASERIVKPYTQFVYDAQVVPSMQRLDPLVAKQLTDVLNRRFSSGFRLNSPIELMRFRKLYAEDCGLEIHLNDEDLSSYIAACGTVFDGKVFAVSENTKARIKEIADDYFADGAQIIFFEAFYAINEGWLFESSVVSKDMLNDILRGLFTDMRFTQTYFGHTNTSVFSALEGEILRVWGDDTLLTYDRLAERLQYIPLERIKYALGQNGDFIWNSVDTFSHISRIDITDEDKHRIQDAAARECNVHGYVSMTTLPYGEIEERNPDLSVTAIHKAVYRLCLSDNFDKKGKIITRKGDVFDAFSIMKKYCRTIDKCSLEDLLNFERELTGEVHRWIPMQAANQTLVRIDRNTYVADRYVYFDVDAIDSAIEATMSGDYIPLKTFTTFGAFPDCGQAWNLFLLESFCRRFSRIFRFDTPSVNSRNAGAIIRKSCGMNYTEIMTDAVAKSDVPLTNTAIGRFLYESGYTGRSTTGKASEIISKATITREGRA